MTRHFFVNDNTANSRMTHHDAIITSSLLDVTVELKGRRGGPGRRALVVTAGPSPTSNSRMRSPAK